MTADTISTSTPRGELPPLRIHHFLAWTAVMAVMVALASSLLISDITPSAHYIYNTVSCVINSAALTCLGFGILWWWRGLRFPTQPGHGLVILYGVECLFWELALAAFATVNFHDERRAQLERGATPSIPRWVDFAHYWRLDATVYLILALLAIVLAVRLARGWRWRTAFIMVVLFHWLQHNCDGMLRSLSNLTQSAFLYEWWRGMHIGAGTLPAMTLLSVLLLAVADDRRRGAAYHWSHWVGVGAAMANGVSLLVWYGFAILSSWWRSA